MEDEYDKDENGGNMPIFTPELGRLKEKEMGQKNEDDEMDDNMPSEYSDSSEDKEDYLIRKTDSLIVAATAENDHSNLEVYIYDHKTSDLYVHHEILLSSYPLCIEWLSHWQGQNTNHVIVGTFLPEIEIWNLDSESVEPTAVLGCLQKSEDLKSGKLVNKFKKGGDTDVGTHTAAVMALSLNPIQNEYLASGSEDFTVRIWDLDDLKCKATFDQLHKDKVQAVKWNPQKDNILLTAGYDHRVNVVDVRDSNSNLQCKIPKSSQDLESAYWHSTLENYFTISTESGIVHGFDTRKMEAPVFNL